MVWLTIHLDTEATLSPTALHYTDRITALLKNPSLCNMKLEESRTSIVRSTG